MLNEEDKKNKEQHNEYWREIEEKKDELCKLLDKLNELSGCGSVAASYVIFDLVLHGGTTLFESLGILEEAKLRLYECDKEINGKLDDEEEKEKEEDEEDDDEDKDNFDNKRIKPPKKFKIN